MIRFLGQRRDYNDRDPAAQILALRGIAKDLSSPSWGQLGDAVASYLDLVEATIQLGGGQGKLVQKQACSWGQGLRMPVRMFQWRPCVARSFSGPRKPARRRTRLTAQNAPSCRKCRVIFREI